MARWVFKEVDEAVVERLTADVTCPVFARSLAAVGLRRVEEIGDFIQPSLKSLHDPFLLPDMPAAVARIETAMQRGETICVCGDYDVDG
ncbi:single-stranded-DNA-specific exonuclease RecJ, partial [bacterium]|nr:single-stranded-DNA-specific exonuclease RecJ [candidate division CSSED10-310 bacterium]